MHLQYYNIVDHRSCFCGKPVTHITKCGASVTAGTRRLHDLSVTD